MYLFSDSHLLVMLNIDLQSLKESLNSKLKLGVLYFVILDLLYALLIQHCQIDTIIDL